jgi:signal transduction histidine kinase
MPDMFRLKVHSPTNQPSAWRWLLGACWAMLVFGSALAQSAAPTEGMSAQRFQVQRTLFVDESGRLDFESVRTQDFKPFNPLERLAIGDKVAWLRLHIEQANGADAPLLMQLIPPHLGNVSVYSPSGTGQWRERTLTPQDFISKTELGAAGQGEDFYLRIHSRHNAAVIAFVGSKEELNLHDKKMAVMTTIISTLALVFFLVMLWRTFHHFSLLNALICSLLVLSQIQHWLTSGLAITLMDLSLAVVMGLATPIIIANIAIAGGIFTVFLTTLFSEQGWLRWMWLWSIFQLGMVVYALFEPSAASNLSMLAWRFGPPIFFAFLLTAAIQAPRTLRQLSNKVVFGVLSLSSAMFVAVSWKSGGILGEHAVELTSNLFIQNILSRTFMLLVIMGLASWFYERLKANQLQAIQNELQVSQESLGIESKRLERQRKFTAMLAHELKNPLAVSHLALSGIKARISLDDPLLQRSAAIEQSLQEIDAIIDRCSEMDGFEQGQLPMRIGAFTLNDLVAALKATHRSDRIYILVQGIAGESVLVSDIHYLKIIFSNLLTNALKYSPPDTLVELAVQAVQRDGQAPMVSFCVSNEVGEAGTPSPDLAFERFYRAESARNQSGAGLGLWLSQSLAHALGTEVVMQIQPEKISFTLVLPCK